MEDRHAKVANFQNSRPQAVAADRMTVLIQNSVLDVVEAILHLPVTASQRLKIRRQDQLRIKARYKITGVTRFENGTPPDLPVDTQSDPTIRDAQRVLERITGFLERKLRLKVNREKSAVDRPWKRKFLGYTMTREKSAKLKPSPANIQRLKDSVRDLMRRGRGRKLERVIAELTPKLRGWGNYFKLSEVKRIAGQALDRGHRDARWDARRERTSKFFH